LKVEEDIREIVQRQQASLPNFSSINTGFDNGNKLFRSDCPLDYPIAHYSQLPGYATDGNTLKFDRVPIF
jgi:hypothetical protein